MSLFEPGWHRDPDGPADQLRYWDGHRWTDDVKPVYEADIAGDELASGSRLRIWISGHRVLSVVILLVALACVAGAVGLSRERSGSHEHPGARSHGDRSAAGDTPDRGDQRRDRHTQSIARDRSEGGPHHADVQRVVRIVDGDTLELGTGETVRLVGIDTPEVGECGYQQAAQELGRLVLGKKVTLIRPEENRDRYGRLLRYVDLGLLDPGLELIRDGLAVARYDSRDGYGFHPRQPAYVRADKANANVSCGAAHPRRFAGTNGGCAAGYSPCVPAYPPDVDCPDVNGPVTVTGTDPHNLDADGDGIACEE